MLVGSILCEVAAGREPHRADLTQPRQTEGIQWLQSQQKERQPGTSHGLPWALSNQLPPTQIEGVVARHCAY